MWRNTGKKNKKHKARKGENELHNRFTLGGAPLAAAKEKV